MSVCAPELIDKGFDLEGINESEIIIGTNATDRIWGYGGNDMLNGGNGDDVYYYAPGDGLDCISDRSGNDVIEFRGGLSAEDIVAGMSSREGQAVLRLRARDGKAPTSRKDGIDVLLDAEENSSIQALRFPDGTACAFADIVRAAPKLGAYGKKASSGAACFLDPASAQQAGLVNTRAQAIPIRPPPKPRRGTNGGALLPVPDGTNK